ncbi:hypothetical protein FQZ97_747470 [compost metagenome]
MRGLVAQVDLGQHARQLAVTGHRVEEAGNGGLRGDRHGHTPGQRGGHGGQRGQPASSDRFGDFIEGCIRRLELHARGQVGGQPGLGDEDPAHDEQGNERRATDLPGRVALDFLRERGDRVEAQERQHRDGHSLHHQPEVEMLRLQQRLQG